MKILFLTSRIPYPLDKGDKLRAYNFIKELSKNNEIILCSICDEKVHPKAESELNKFCKSFYIFNINKLGILASLLKAVFSKLPFQVAYFTNTSIQKSIDEIVANEKPDIIYYQLVRMAEYAQNNSIPKFLDYMDVLSVGIEKRIEQEPFYKKWIFNLEFERLKKYEDEVFGRFKKQSIITEQDRDLIPTRSKHQIEIVSNGVDFDYFIPPLKVYEKRFDIVFSGNMAYPPNVVCAVYLVKKIMPLVWSKNKNVKVVIVGTSPSKQVLELASENVFITGRVDDIRTYFYESKIFVAPLFMNTGLQNKLLEAMAMKTPCITSSVANNALKATPSLDLLIADNENEFAVSILSLLSNENEMKKISESAYNFIFKNHNWSAIGNQLNQLLIETKND